MSMRTTNMVVCNPNLTLSKRQGTKSTCKCSSAETSWSNCSSRLCKKQIYSKTMKPSWKLRINSSTNVWEKCRFWQMTLWIQRIQVQQVKHFQFSIRLHKRMKLLFSNLNSLKRRSLFFNLSSRLRRKRVFWICQISVRSKVSATIM